MANASQTTSDLKGDLLSVKMFGATGDGITDDRQAFQDGIDYLYSKGGGYLRVPKTDSGLYLVGDYITIKDKVILLGEGDGSLLKRGGSDVTAGYGLITIDGVDAGVQDLKIDGDVTTSVNLLYGAGTSSVLFNNDPMDSKLVLNTSIWVRPGAHNVWIAGVTITHTGGYSILLDAQDGDIRNASILDCFFENNRPHLFGVDAVTPANNIYGAWTGGIFAKGDCRSSAGKLFAVQGLTVRSCKFHRMNGNCIWAHSYGFDTQHKNFVIANNQFRHIARDGYLAGNQIGGSCVGNSAEYVGFTHGTDNDTPVAAYLANNYAVAFDCSGYVADHPFLGNSVTEFYGGGFDLDGLRESVVSGNTVSSSQPVAKGLQTGDTSANGGGYGVVITGNRFKGCNAGAIVLNEAENCLCENNIIDHPTGAVTVPILLYSTSNGTTNNTVRNNHITYPDAAYCIAEAGTFDATCQNLVYGNRCEGGNLGEFLRDANSSSISGIFLSTNASSATNRSEFILQREGFGTAAALKGYTRNSTTTKQRLQVTDYRDGSNEDAVINASLDGAAGTGIYCTGNRSSFGFGDLMASGHMLGYGFMAILGKGATGNVYDDTRADLFNDDWALLRFDESTPQIEISVVTSVGSRVWVPLSSGGGGTPGGSNTQVQFNDGGAFAGDSGLVWDKTNNVLTITGVTTTAGLVVASAFIQSAEGFYSPGTASTTVNIPSGGVTALSLIAIRNDAADAWTIARTSATARQYGFSINSSGELILTDVTGSAARMKVTTAGVFQWGGTNVQIDQAGAISAVGVISSTGASGGVNVPSATATNAIQAPNGGVTAKYLITTESIFGIGVSAPSLSGSGQGKLHFNSSSNKWQYSEDGSSWANCFGTGSVAGANTEVQFNNSGAFGASSNFTWTNGSKLLTVTGNTGTAGIATVTCFIQSAEGFLTNDSSSDAVNVPNGGVTALSLISVRNDGASGIYINRTSATARSYGLGVDSSGSFVLRDETGSAARLTMDTSGQITIGSTVAINQSGAVTISGVLNCNGASGGVNVSSNSAYNCIQASNSGGMAARSFTATTYIQMGQSSGTPSATTSDSLNNGCLYYDTSTSKARVRIAGSFVDIATGSAGGVTSLNSLTGALSIAAGTAISVSPSGSTVTIANTGVTSATGTSNQVNVSASTGAVTFSLPQSIHTGASPTFNALTITTTVQASNTGTGITFQNTGGSGFQVNGNGVVSCTSLNVSGVTAIDSSRNTSFAILTWSGQTRGPYTADTGLSFASSAGKIAYYDTAGNFKGWIPVLP